MGIRTETIRPGFDATAVLPGSGGGPGVLLLQEIFGVNEFLLAKARDLAALGYVVLCPDLFWRIEPGVALPHDEAALAAAFGYVQRYAEEVDDDTKAADMLDALAHLRALPECTGRVAAVGYCLGGRVAYELAVHGDPDACVSYYGSGIADRLEAADAITCPVLFHFGANDAFIPGGEVDRIRSRFADRPDVAIHVQPEAGHAFENLFAPAFGDADAAARSWPITVEFLRRHLG